MQSGARVGFKWSFLLGLVALVIVFSRHDEFTLEDWIGLAICCLVGLSVILLCSVLTAFSFAAVEWLFNKVWTSAGSLPQEVLSTLPRPNYHTTIRGQTGIRTSPEETLSCDATMTTTMRTIGSVMSRPNAPP
jgi:hypothetical protein